MGVFASQEEADRKIPEQLCITEFIGPHTQHSTSSAVSKCPVNRDRVIAPSVFVQR
jgi:hypothetical protein